MDFFKFADSNPFLVFVAVIAICWLISRPFDLVEKYIDHLNVKERGYPLEYVEEPEDAEESEDKEDGVPKE